MIPTKSILKKLRFGIGIDFEKFGILGSVFRIRDLGSGFDIEFGKFGVKHSTTGEFYTILVRFKVGVRL